MSHYYCQSCDDDMPVPDHDQSGCENDANGLCIHISKAEAAGWLPIRVEVRTRHLDRSGEPQEQKTFFTGNGWLCPECVEHYKR
jgi:hypothetical protein